MKMIKKFVPYFSVGIVSTLLTYGIINYTTNQENEKEYFSWSNDGNPNQNASYSLVNYPPNDTPNFVNAAEKSVNAVVSIKNFGEKRKQQIDPFFEDFFNFGFPQFKQKQDENAPSGLGSGVIISADGYIITNNHVIDGASKVEVVLNNQKTYAAEVIGKDANTEIALLKINQNNLPFLNFVDSDNVKVGEWVLAVGNPFGLNSTVTAGIVSAKGRSLGIIKNRNNSPIESFIQTDAAINPGNSGGALVNQNGDLVGINTAIQSQTGSYVGYGFAVPSNLAKKIVEDIRRFGVVQRGFLGINTIDLSNDTQLNEYNRKNGINLKTQEGILIDGLIENGGAIDAGLEKGDIITEIDGDKIKSFANLSSAVGNKRPGDAVTVKILRNGKERTYNVVLKDAKGNTKVKAKSDMTISEKLGAEFEPLTERQKINYGLDSGVLVKNISEGKLKSVGVDEDYILITVNGKSVNTSNDVEKIVALAKGTISIEYLDPYGRLIRRGFQLD